MRTALNTESIINDISLNGFSHFWDLNKSLNTSSTELKQFRSWWRNLIPDENFRQYTCRERRILRYRLAAKSPEKLEINRDPNYTSTMDYDAPYQRGINSLTYAEEDFIQSPALKAILQFDLEIALSIISSFELLEIDIHQFRVTASMGQHSPTTSGVHQDGYNLVFMHFVGSYNVHPVSSEVFSSDAEESLLYRIEMEAFMETFVVNDTACWHRASAVKQKNRKLPAWRDMLVVSFRRLTSEVAE